MPEKILTIEDKPELQETLAYNLENKAIGQIEISGPALSFAIPCISRDVLPL